MYSLLGAGHPLFVGKQDVVLSWDMSRESCTGKFTLAPDDGQPGFIAHVLGSNHAPTLHVADSKGRVCLFDLRSGERVWTLQPQKSALAGLVETGEALVAGYPNGQMLFIDTRKTGVDAVISTVEAHTATMAAIASHPHAPVLATVFFYTNYEGVVRDWSKSGGCETPATLP